MDYCLYLISGQILPYFANLIEIKPRTLAELSHLLLQADKSKLLRSLEVCEWKKRQLITVMLGLQAENSKLLVILGLWVEKGIDYSYTLGLQADKSKWSLLC